MFDGVHLGHQALINETIVKSTQYNSNPFVFTFLNHPKTMLGKTPKLLTTPTERKNIILSMGVEPILVPFTTLFLHQKPIEFLEYLQSVFDLEALIVGFDYRFGYQAEGSVEFLAQWCENQKIELIVIDPILYKDEKISSSRIRNCLETGNVRDANYMLGRKYSFCNVVIPHAQIGRSLGFPTANISPNEKVIPHYGVYITNLKLDDKYYPSITNIGKRPTVENNGEVIIETYILNENIDLYGKNITVELHEYIRPELHFANEAELRKQMQNDCDRAVYYHRNNRINI